MGFLHVEICLAYVFRVLLVGPHKGKPKKYTDRHRGLQYALELFFNRDINRMTVKDIESITKISRATLYRAAKDREKVNEISGQ
ncbi:TetR family transcriptional regulator [Fictibacillus sp. 7GRE50]|nr:TetR family transcriptional regulator [Fictibacillus sp. 7GRE50]